MTDEKRFIHFSVGAVVGLGFSLLFLVWAVPEFRNPTNYIKLQSLQYIQNRHNKQELLGKEASQARLQQEQIAASQSIAKYAFWSVVVAGFGNILLIVTLFFAGRANKAAFKAVSETTRIGEAQTRAYLSIEDIKELPDKPDRNSDTPYCLEPHLKNTGRSPAIDLELSYKLQTEGFEKQNVLSELDSASKGSLGADMIAPKPTEELTSHDWEAAVLKTPFLVVYFTYKDVFGKQYSGYFAWKLGKVERKSSAYLERDWTATPYLSYESQVTA